MVVPEQHLTILSRIVDFGIYDMFESLLPVNA